MPDTLKRWSKKVFLRDVSITRKGFVYFLLAFIYFMIAIQYAVLYFIEKNPMEIISIITLTTMLIAMGSIIVGSIIVDNFKNRMVLLLIMGGVILFGLVLLIPNHPILGMIGVIIILVGSIIYLINLLTLVTHESTILNRGRMTGYLFCISFLIAISTIGLSFFHAIPIFIIECLLFGLSILIARDYKYIETAERMKSDLKFREICLRNPILGYLFAFLVIGFILGNAFPVDYEIIIEPVTFTLFVLFFLVITGVFLDRMGRKWSFVAGILIFSALIIFAGIFQDLYNAVFFGIAVPIIIITLLTFSGDFSTERNTIKYRGRITGIFLLFVVGGFLGGVLVKIGLLVLYANNQQLLYWMPDLINGINSILLIGLLVWIMPLKEILSAKEADWSRTLRNLYVFNRDSICLYAKNFIPDENVLSLSEDLVTGGLAGILTLISEITNERKNLRIIDKDRVKIYFSYGKKIIVALISTKFLPILYKKMDAFTKSFEKKFEFDLEHFAGKINVFTNKSDPLVSRYFE